ncbi:hypothetical protein [Thermobrachium celere]|uniref:hypothetical protein n=1 Tax=Thermobrachium celere TaxID=53422 RepID=UPI00194453DA|nr:hypothetical protein [Thermobrachium celere]GFR36239.1 hypothetical protein TCEA9_20510 [Thermobrachium celere]
MRFVKKIFIYALIGVVLTVLPLYYVNNILLAEASADEIKEVALTNIKSVLKKNGITIPNGAELISLTNDENVVAYLLNGQVILKDIKSDSEVERIVEDSDIIYFKPLYDRNIILYFIYSDNQIKIMTYNMDTKDKMEHKSFRIDNFVRVKDIKYSSLTNVIYVLVETGTENGSVDKVYRIDIMKNVSLFLKDKNGIKDIELLNKEDRLIYQDFNGAVYDKGKRVVLKVNKTRFKEFDILGIDELDNLYLYEKAEKSIFVYKDKEFVDGKSIPDFEFDRIISKNNRIYLVKGKRVYDVINFREFTIDEADEIIDILNGRVLYKRNGIYECHPCEM